MRYLLFAILAAGAIAEDAVKPPAPPDDVKSTPTGAPTKADREKYLTQVARATNLSWCDIYGKPIQGAQAAFETTLMFLSEEGRTKSLDPGYIKQAAIAQENLVFLTEAIKPPPTLQTFHLEEVAREKKIAAALTRLQRHLKATGATTVKRNDPMVVEAADVLKAVQAESNVAWKPFDE